MNDLPGALELLSTRVEALEKRVHALECPVEAGAPVVLERSSAVVAPSTEETTMEQAGGMFPVFGKAMLGIAGAYVLRAVAESSSLPKLAIAGAAIAYALAWLTWAARAKTVALSARVVYACTSALILAPMLWELTLHFKVLSPAVAAGVLGAFALTATVLAWNRELAPVFWVAHGIAALTALALSIATHVLAPLIAALLLMVLICEYAMARDRGKAIRPLIVVVADVAIWALIFVYAGPQNARVDYPELGTAALLAPACLLFLIGGASLAVKTLLLKKNTSAFETIQAIVAFLLAVSSVLYFAPRAGSIILGVACLTLSAACYAVVFGYFRYSVERRNFNVFGAWSAGLLLAGVLWSLPASAAGACLAAIALAAVVLGVRMRCTMLEFHGLVYLLTAAVTSRLPEYAFRALAGPLPEQPQWNIFLIFACSVLCYAAAKDRAGEAWQQQLLHLVPALLATCAAAALVTQGLLKLAALSIALDVFHVAFIRTLTVCSVALALAFGGSRWRRLEMTRIAYAALAFVAAKLLFEDLRHGRMEFIAGSIFLFAVTLIAVPRLARTGRKIEAKPQPGAVLQKKI